MHLAVPAFHRPRSDVAYVAETLRIQSLAEARTLAGQELGRERKSVDDVTRVIAVRYHVLRDV